MENPGYTIFQGGDSIKVDTSLNRLEEEEAIEDQKRRNEELGNQLQYAFDDLIDDDDCTVDSSLHMASAIRQHSPQFNAETEIPSQHTEYEHNDHNMYQNQAEISKLQKTIESKNREIENISKLVFEERKKNDELKKRLALAEAEKERTNMQRQQSHELLVESKTQISELEDSILKLKTKIKNLEDTNNELVGELERTKTMLNDCQHKYYLVEKNAGLNADKHADAVIKQINERHSGQIQMMQHQIDNIKEKLEEKESEYRILDTRYKELQRSREALLVEKAETINELARSLEDSQRQCQNLMAKQDFAEENIRLQRLVSALERQTQDMQKTINNLTARLETTTAELEMMDSVLCENGESSPRQLSQTKANIIGSTPLTVTDRISKLKNELYRSMASQKQKREEIKRLQEELSLKNNEIKQLKDYENKILVEIEMYKDEKIRFESKIRALEMEIHQMRTKNVDKECNLQQSFEDEISEIQRKNENLKSELKNALENYKRSEENYKELTKEIDKLQTLLRRYKDKEDDLTKKLKRISIDFEDLKKENEKLKNLNNGEYIKHDTEAKDVLTMQLEKYKYLLKDAQNECDRIKNLYVEASNERDALNEKINDYKSQNMIAELKEKYEQIENALESSELKCKELQKLLESQRNAYEKKLNDLKSELEKNKGDALKDKKNTLNNCNKCIDNLSKISEHEIQNLKLQNQCSEYLKAQIDLENRLKESQKTIDELTEKLTLKNQSDQIISDLKVKAQQFEEFIRNQNNSNGSSSGISSPKQQQQQIKFYDKSVETSPELNNYDDHERRKIETQIRNEMAKIFAIEIKRIENHFEQNSLSIQEQNNELKNDLHKINTELKQRQKEVELLKYAIIVERKKMQEMLNECNEEAKKSIDKHTVMLNKCRDELQAKTEHIEELVKILDERNAQIENDRQSMKSLMAQWEDQRKKTDEQVAKWKQLINNHAKVVEQLQSKYNSAKRTAANYKKYAEDKEKHMLKEYDRIKSGYEESIAKLEKRMKEILEKKESDMKDRIREVESNYDHKMEELKKQLTLKSNIVS